MGPGYSCRSPCCQRKSHDSRSDTNKDFDDYQFLGSRSEATPWNVSRACFVAYDFVSVYMNLLMQTLSMFVESRDV